METRQANLSRDSFLAGSFISRFLGRIQVRGLEEISSLCLFYNIRHYLLLEIIYMILFLVIIFGTDNWLQRSIVP